MFTRISGRPVMQYGVAIASLFILGGRASLGGDQPIFRGYADLADKVQIAQCIDDDPTAMTIMFRNLAVESSGTDKLASLSAIRSVTVSLPLAHEKQAVQVKQWVRGYYQVGARGKPRAVLLVQAAGKSTLIELNKETHERKRKDHPPELKRLRQRAKKQIKDESEMPKEAIEFEHVIEGTVAPDASYQVSFVLLVERDNASQGSDVQLVVTSLDVLIEAGTEGK